MHDTIFIKNARVHNLKGIDVRIPRNELCVITGISGSGKSSLAFDTLYAEGQRRYVESLSAYARQFLEQMHKPDVDYIEGLSPAISIEQRVSASNPRSTVGTTTEIYDYLRLLFASIGKSHCYKCGKPITRQSSQEIVDRIMGLGKDLSLHVLAPVVEGRKGEYREVFQDILREGFVRARVDGRIMEVTDKITLDKKRKHQIDIVIDRLHLNERNRKRLADSVETGLKVGKGVIKAVIASPRAALRSEQAPAVARSEATKQTQRAATEIASGAELILRECVGRSRNDRELLFSERNACIPCGLSFPALEPRMFSFNSPYGACAHCDGLGNKMEIDPRLVIPDRAKSIRGGAIEAWKRGGKSIVIYLRRLLRHLADREGFSLDAPFKDLSRHQQKLILYGHGEGDDGYRAFEGVIPNLERRFRNTDSEYMKTEIAKFMSEQNCPACKGSRLKPQHLAVTVGGMNIMELTRLSIDKATDFFNKLELTPKEELISRQILKEIKERLKFLKNVGLDYLTLSRPSSSLSGGEAQRIRLATQIGSGLMGVLYVLDEPSIGLHQRDNRKLLETLRSLQRLGNTLVVVEHDEATIREADYIIDLGPGAGHHGGSVVVAGRLEEVLAHPTSLTARYLRGDESIPIPRRRDARGRKALKVLGASEHNLKGIDVEFPLGVFICVSGVSGSGKSTLVDDILYRALARRLYRSRSRAGAHERLVGVEHIDKVVVIDQSPIGRTPRSNPATYTGLFGPVRDLFSRLPESRVRGYRPGRFSFNVKGGRCEACEGDGVEIIEMHFLPDVYVECEVCKGRRFNAQTLEVQFKGKTIADVLKLNVDEALKLFDRIPGVRSKLKTLADVGLGYVELGQSATTLSGGEAQRVKLATELSRRATGKTFYMLDEPTTGLHFHDIAKLLQVLEALVDKGNTVLVIEHNLDVIKCADHVIDLGPEGGDKGGRVVAQGTPEEVSRVAGSYTGQHLKKVIERQSQKRREGVFSPS